MTPRCRHLRWKSVSHGGEADEADILASMLRRQVPFSCLRTCQAWGPDDELVAPEDCVPERPCYVATDSQ